ncbi:MFS transporter [Beijerinckia sp. L45]|uniref:MFS transporter n=1 Tax=Beijerinckia sp. L45 TaxID=1641855 RepID=UPI001FEF2F67|nr:MFS transporter [Beijerinckia sp. L45]
MMPTTEHIDVAEYIEIKEDRTSGFVGAYLGWAFDGYETFATVLVAPAIVNDLVGPGIARSSPLYVGGILAATLVAWGFGGLAGGILADYVGRRRVLILSILWYSIFAAVTAFSNNYVIFLALRFLTGIGMGAEWAAGSSLVSELWPPKWRGRAIAVLQSGFGFGFIAATVAWHYVNTGSSGSWRWMYLIGAAPAVVALLIRRKVRDPKLWVEANAKRRAIKEDLGSGVAVSARSREFAKLTVSQIFESPLLRKRVGLLLLAALSTTLGWWAVSAWIPQFVAQQVAGKVADVPQAVTYVVIAYNVVGIIGYLVMGWLADTIGRKPTMMIYFAGSLIAVPLLFLVPAGPVALIGLAGINGFFTLGQWTWIALYPTELFPTHVRSTAITLVFNTTRFVVAVGTLLSAEAVHLLGSISTAATVIGSAYVVGLLVTPWLGPETKGLPLPDFDDLKYDDVVNSSNLKFGMQHG